MPKISIIVPIYNAEKVLKRCVDSILNQSYKNFELILINDGSKDKSIDIIKLTLCITVIFLKTCFAIL